MPADFGQRARHLKSKRSLMVGAFLSLIIYAVFVAGITALVKLITTEDRTYGIYFLGAVLLWGICLAIRSILGRSCKCPLCHGQWLVERRCRMNDKARKYPLMKYRTSLLIDVMLRWRFRCQYCGTPYRLKR
jgi:hypothetical protein